MSVPAAGDPTDTAAEPRRIVVVFRSDWAARDGRGLLSSEPRVRTLRKVLVSYPDVRHILPDRVSLAAGADPRMLDTVARFLARQHWLVRAVAIQ